MDLAGIMEKTRTNSLNNNDSRSDAEVQGTRERKWTSLFWAILKFMCLYYHRTVVPRRRTCFSCSVDRLRKRSCAGGIRKLEEYDAGMDPLLVQYEYDDTQVEGRGGGTGGEETPLLDQAGGVSCPVCDTLWWDRDGETKRYTELDIGIGWWNHRGSGALSLLLLMGALALIFYDIADFLGKLWGKPDLTLHLMIKVTLYVIILLYPMLSICSKLRSIFTSAMPSSQWASALTVRFLVRRAQILDIGRRGLPGKLLLLVCITTPFLTAIYRFLIFTVFSECGFRLGTIVTSIVGVIFNQSWGLYLYLFYFMRVSFQRQFNLLILYIKDHEGDEARCKGALFSVAVDFNCFRQLVNLSIFIMFPAMVFAVSGNLTYQYLLANVTCITNNTRNLDVSHHTLRLAWSEIFLSLGTYLVAIGDIHVEYVFNNFVVNLLHLRSSRHWMFWNNLYKDIAHVTKHSYFFLVTIIFSFISLFLAFNFGEQDIANLVFCNTTHDQLCV